jgi:LacI family transcriptional regulator/LacI family fructose operon transcriptional repressor
MSRPRPTIYDLAAASGSSPSAVSAILNGSWKKRRISAKTAERVLAAARDAGYAPNLQASLLRRATSNIVGMIIPKYDNRYFGAIAEAFERTARGRGLFPVITCTERDPSLEAAAARELVSYSVGSLVACGATDPDGVASICAAAGVPTVNLDLPGARAPSVVSDNRGGAGALAGLLLDDRRARGQKDALHFVGGRASDPNTADRIEGFRAAHAERGVAVPDANVQPCGYAPERAFDLLNAMNLSLAAGLFVNSTISLEGVVRCLAARGRLANPTASLVCFDWDPFAALLPGTLAMARKDAETMVNRTFDLLDERSTVPDVYNVPCVIERLDG